MAIRDRRWKPSLTANQTRVQTSRLAHRIESLAEHRAGLDQAATLFGDGEIDPEAWRHTFELLRSQASDLVRSAVKWLQRSGVYPQNS